MKIPQIEGFFDVVNSMQDNLGVRVTKVEEVNAGLNNRLFRIFCKNNESYFVKFYKKDERLRLEREFTALKFLADKSFKNIPKTFLKNDKYQYAVYSFEKGKTKNPAKINKKDIENILNFVVSLHKIKFSEETSNFRPAVLACFSAQNYLDNINFRLKAFEDYISSGTANSQVGKFTHENNIIGLINNLVKTTIKDMDKKQITSKIRKSQWRLNPTDFSLANILFQSEKESSICFVDFEYFGWDDPMRMIADFINHDMNLALSVDLKSYFVSEYKNRTNLSILSQKRLDMIINLYAIEWLTIYLYSITPTKIESRKFSNKNFNEKSYVKKQLSKFNTRLREILGRITLDSINLSLIK